MDRHSDPADRINTDELVEYLQEAPIRLAVFGEFSAGKTTALNALIGEEILSVAVEPTTAVPTRIRYGREFNIFIERVDGETLALFEDDPPFWTRFVGRRDTLNTLEKQQDTIRDFLQRWTKEGEKAGEVERVIIELPLDWLKGGLELVDTPGVNNEFVRHQGFTEQEAGDADIAVLLMDARQGGAKRTEFEFMNDVQQQVERCIVAPNKMDLIPADEREEFLGYIHETALPKHWEGAVTPPVMGISALAALHPEDYEEPGLVASFEEVRERLETLAREERGKLLLARKGNPEKQFFAQAREREAEGEYDRAHRLYFDLLDVMEAAGLDSTPAEEGVARCEENLSAQVDTLDELNERYNEAMTLAEEDPDSALERLESIRDEKEELRLEDGDLHASIEQLQSRIEERDAAREEIQQIEAQVEHHRENENWIEAVETAQEILSLINLAEVSENREENLRDFIDSQVSRRNSWISEQWPEAKNHINTHLSEGDPAQAEKALAPFVPVPADSPHAVDIEETKTRVQTRTDALEAFRDARSKILTQIGQLQEEQVDRSTGRFFLQTLRRLAEGHRELHGGTDTTVDLTEIDLKIDAEGYALTVEEKIDLIEAAITLLDDDVDRLHGLKAQLTERKEELQNLDPNVPRRREELFNKYPDHPRIGTEDPSELTSLELACMEGNLDALREIIAGTGRLLLNVKAKLRRNSSPHRNEDTYEPEGLDGSEFDQDGEMYTPLMIAAREGHHKTVDTLLDAGADPDERSQSDFTALHFAAYEGNSECVDCLLHETGNPSGTDVNGFNALDWAVIENNEDTQQILRSKGLRVTESFSDFEDENEINKAESNGTANKRKKDSEKCDHLFDGGKCKKCGITLREKEDGQHSPESSGVASVSGSFIFRSLIFGLILFSFLLLISSIISAIA
ncbi:signal recognition particle receptor subunit beta [Salinibacter ruber]|uniref:Signal recognition particle receptor subunit beta n=1 Tax=Salinibacter ruber TaxID=146919 RepID=A0A9X2Q2N6_9BACT|nr:dynamin family protein [Salinibacter ruber]MCS3679329.1 signal recognition particle receptor subunit beta [Salinibacter ruber]MCS3682615.1 signal recognition particle receptor subunit beta [Salinibacter ruber]